jgi:hypothetical protein
LLLEIFQLLYVNFVGKSAGIAQSDIHELGEMILVFESALKEAV